MAKKVGKHQTIPKELKQHIAWLRSMAEVMKVVCGRVENCRTKFPAGYVAFNSDQPVGFKGRGYFGAGVMDFYVYLDDPSKRDEIKRLLADRFKKRTEKE